MEQNPDSPGPHSAADQLAQALRDLHNAADKPSYSQLDRYGRRRSVPVEFTPASLSAWFNGRAVPSKPEVFRALVDVLLSLADKHGTPYRHHSIRQLEHLRLAAQSERSTGAAPSAATSAKLMPAAQPPAPGTPRPAEGQGRGWSLWRRPRHAAWAVALAAALALVLVIWRPWHTDESGAGAGPTKSATRSGTSGGASTKASDGPTGSIPEALVLRSTILTLSDLNERGSLAFPDRTTPVAMKYLAVQRASDLSFGSIMSDVESGVFLLGGANVSISLEGLAHQQEVAVFGVRPVNLQRVTFPSDAALLGFSQGNTTDEMQVVLDDPIPIAKVKPGEPGAGKPYFQGRRIGLPSGGKATLSVSLAALRSAFTFQLAVDYEVGGHTYTHVVGSGGKPFTFRVAPDPCPSVAAKQTMTSQDIAELSGLRFGSLRGGYYSTSAGEYLIKDLDAAQYTYDGEACGSRTTTPRPG